MISFLRSCMRILVKNTSNSTCTLSGYRASMWRTRQQWLRRSASSGKGPIAPERRGANALLSSRIECSAQRTHGLSVLTIRRVFLLLRDSLLVLLEALASRLAREMLNGCSGAYSDGRSSRCAIRVARLHITKSAHVPELHNGELIFSLIQ